MMKKEKSSHLLLKTTAILTSFLGAGLLVNGTQQVAANANAVNTTVAGSSESSSSAPATSSETSTATTTASSTVTPAQSNVPSAPAATQPARTIVNANATVTPAQGGTQAQVNGTTTPANGTAVANATTTAPLTEEEKAKIAQNSEIAMTLIGQNILNGVYKSEKDFNDDVQKTVATVTNGRSEVAYIPNELSKFLTGDSKLKGDEGFSPEFIEVVTKVNEKQRFSRVGNPTTEAVSLKEENLAKFGEADVVLAIKIDGTVPNVFLSEVRGLDKLKSAKHGDTVELEALLLAEAQQDLIAKSVPITVTVDNDKDVKIAIDGAKHPLLKSELPIKTKTNGNLGNPGDKANTQKTSVNATFDKPSTSNPSKAGSTSQSGTSGNTAARSLNLPSTGETRAAVVLAAGLATLSLAGFLFFRHRSIKK